MGVTYEANYFIAICCVLFSSVAGATKKQTKHP